MKKVTAIILFVFSLLSLSSCNKEVRAATLLEEFIILYGCSGIVYSYDKSITEEGYITEDTISKLYVYEGDFPKNFAVLLNSRTTEGFEIGAFVYEDEEEREKIIDMCRERLELLSEEASLLLRSKNIIFYSTAKDKKKAERIFNKIIRSYY